MTVGLQVAFYLGIVMVLAGLAGLVLCIRRAARLRGAPLPPDEGRREISKLAALNMASVGAAFLGLGLVIVGLLL